VETSSGLLQGYQDGAEVIHRITLSPTTVRLHAVLVPYWAALGLAYAMTKAAFIRVFCPYEDFINLLIGVLIILGDRK